MPARKMRIELSDSEGNRYSIAFEGQITRDKAVRLLDLVELLGGAAPGSPMSPDASPSTSSDVRSKFERIRMLAQKQFPLVWFSSREIQNAFEQEFKQPISLSTVSTYMTRLTGKGILSKTGPPNRLKYKLASNLLQATLKQQVP